VARLFIRVGTDHKNGPKLSALEIFDREIWIKREYKSTLSAEARRHFVKNFKLVLLELAIMATLVCYMRAGPTDAGPISIQVRPENGTVLLHQPFDVMLIIHNSSSQVAQLDLGDDRKSNIVLTVEFPDGTEKTCRVAQHQGLARIGRIKIQPGRTYSQPLVVNDWVDFAIAGIYRMTVYLRVPIRLDDGTIVEPKPLRVVASVTGPNSKALTDFCREALQNLLSSKTYSEAQHAAEVLGYTQDPLAVPYLGRAFDTPYPVQSLLVTGLERIGTDDSIRVLLEVAHNKPKAAPEAIKQALANLVNRTSDPDLQFQIKQTLEGKM
jgi:hypothetical protein